jgi:hypothetical protein
VKFTRSGTAEVDRTQAAAARHTDVHCTDAINTNEHEVCPMVTPDGKYLFFSRFHGGSWESATDGAVFWADASIVDQFRP